MSNLIITPSESRAFDILNHSRAATSTPLPSVLCIILEILHRNGMPLDGYSSCLCSIPAQCMLWLLLFTPDHSLPIYLEAVGKRSEVQPCQNFVEWAICFLCTYICGNTSARHVGVGSLFSLAAKNREKLREVALFSASIMTKKTHTISCLSLTMRTLGKKLVFQVQKHSGLFMIVVFIQPRWLQAKLSVCTLMAHATIILD